MASRSWSDDKARYLDIDGVQEVASLSAIPRLASKVTKWFSWYKKLFQIKSPQKIHHTETLYSLSQCFSI